MRKSSIYAIVGYILRAGACVGTFFGVKASIDGFNKRDQIQVQYREAYGKQFQYEQDHTGEDYSNNPEYLALVSEVNAYDEQMGKQEKDARLKFWTISIPSIIVPLILFSVTTAIWTEKQKEDL